MSEVKLLPCPFCGGEAVLESDVIGKGKELYYVSCKNDCVTQYGYKTTKDGAITAWNTRKPMERILERLEECYDNRHEAYMVSRDLVDLGRKYGVEEAIEIVKEEGGIE